MCTAPHRTAPHRTCPARTPHVRLPHAQVGSASDPWLDGPQRLRRAVLEFRQRVRLARRLHVLDTARDLRSQQAVAALGRLPAGLVRRVLVVVIRHTSYVVRRARAVLAAALVVLVLAVLGVIGSWRCEQ